MPNPIINVPEFPNVAQLPGVPQLVRANQAINTVRLAVGAVSQFLGAATAAKPTWAILDANGNVIIQPDSFLDFDNSNEWKIADFPIQDGEFSSYNKVVIPYTASVKLSKGGSLQDRKNLLDKIQSIAGDTNLYSILTPEKQYPDVNILRYAIRRLGREGAYFFADLEIFFRNIQSVSSQYSTTTANTVNAQNPAATPSQNLGNQLAQATVPASVQQVVTVVLLHNGVPVTP